jgi:Cyclic nucleotide-binding domain
MGVRLRRFVNEFVRLENSLSKYWIPVRVTPLAGGWFNIDSPRVNNSMPTSNIQSDETPQYRVWGLDNVAYGPVELPVLTNWVLDERVTADTWVFAEEKKTWLRAAQLSELTILFERRSSAAGATPAGIARPERIKTGSLRRIKILADMEEKQLESFVQFMEVVAVRQFAEVFRRGDHGDAMYLVLEGELRARVIVDKKETTLSTMKVGDFFGEISLLDEGPRSADVIANSDSRLLKVSSAAFASVMREAPALAASFLYGLSKSIGARVRVLTQKYQDSIHFSRLAGAVH